MIRNPQVGDEVVIFRSIGKGFYQQATVLELHPTNLKLRTADGGCCWRMPKHCYTVEEGLTLALIEAARQEPTL